MTTAVRSRAIEALFTPHDVRVFCAPVDEAFIEEMHAEEAPQAQTMAPNRQAEYATARACARAALQALGATGPVGRFADGAPNWPSGTVGSISHSRGYCVATVALGTDFTIGIDVESVDRIKPMIERRVLVAAERTQSEVLDVESRRLFVATIFAAKEAFYKAQYPRTRKFLGFDAVLVQQGNDGAIDFERCSDAADERLVGAAHGARLYDAGRVIVGVSIAGQRC